MEKVHGIGGFFFRARDPDGLAKWYATHLGEDPEGNPIQLREPGGVDKSLEGA